MYQEDKKTNLIKIILRIVLFVLVFVLTYKLLGMLFNSTKRYLDTNNMSANLNSMQNAALKYFKDGSTMEVGATKKLTLNELIEKDLVGELKDEYQHVCDKNESYIELLRLDNEYRVKSYLICNSKSDSIYTFIDDLTKEEERNREPSTTTANVETTTTTTTTTGTTKQTTTTNKTTKKTTTKKTTTKKTTKKVTTTVTTRIITRKVTVPIVITTSADKWSVGFECGMYGTSNGYTNFSKKVEKGKSFVMPSIKENSEHKFLYWRLQKDGEFVGEYYPGDEVTPNGNMTFRAFYS